MKKEETKTEKSCQVPLYIQLAESILQDIYKGKYGPGTRLPSEKEFSEEKQVAVGTVRKAYEYLRKRNMIYKVRGSGSYVKFQEESRQTSPEVLAGEVFRQLWEYTGSYRKSLKLVQQETAEYFLKDQIVTVALVECNEEILHALVPIVESIDNVQVKPYLLKNIMSGKEVIAGQCDIAFVSRVHYGDFIRYCDALDLRAEVFVLRESRETIARLATLPENQEIYLLYRNQEFLENVKRSLQRLDKKCRLTGIGEEQLQRMDKEWSKKEPILLLPPDYLEYSNAGTLRVIEKARKRKWKVFPVCYEIEQGSWIHLVNTVKGLL